MPPVFLGTKPTAQPPAPRVNRQPPPLPIPINQIIEITPSHQLRACDFCGESIQSVAKKCRHCGEILDPILRSAEETRRLVLHTSREGSRVVINNTVAASASALVLGHRVPTRSLAERMVRLMAAAMILLLVGFVAFGTATEPSGPQAVAGMTGVVTGVLMLIVGDRKSVV